MGAMRDLQLIPHADPKDHVPMPWRLKYCLHYQDDHEGDPTWDYDRLAGLAAPRGDHDLVGELERLCENTAAAWRSSSRQDDPSEAWQPLVSDIREAASPLYQRGAPPGPTSEYAQQRQVLLERRRNLSRQCRTETDRLAIRACDREIKRTKRRLDTQHVEQLLREATAAAERGHTTTVWKLAYQIGGRYHGVRNRRFNTIPHYPPSLDEWTTTLLADAAEGGFSAVQIPEPEFPAEIALALREQNDPDGTWKDLRGYPAAIAYNDWTDTLRREETRLGFLTSEIDQTDHDKYHTYIAHAWRSA
ncbi:unnamed protein product [Prorocentrum cordatum]|uniref:Uncharacterized protein n=1 Tax=Prorocentrum cordatum TaxID=2364126 RepID=A0ABN9U6E8_9DINO|nr:unnamed protein product [Polarella glacialis]